MFSPVDIKDFLKSAYQPQRNTKNVLEKKKVEGKYDSELSTPDTRVFVSSDGTPHIVHRGSKTAKDYGTDVLLGLGLDKYSTRLQRAQNVTRKVEEKYGKTAAHMGHSLGGMVAERVATKGAPVTTYNKGVSLNSIGKTIPKSQTDYRVNTDLVSLPAVTQKHKGKLVNIKGDGKGLLDSHSLKHLNKINKIK
jgi:hypothetical protein